jgi:hypothetical protein
MAPVIVVETLDQRGGVRSRTRIAALPATIGRGYDNDVMLDDPFVCPQHVRLSLDESGQLVAEDLASVNGMRLAGQSGRMDRVPLRSGATLRVGRTTLRFCDASHPVAATVVDGPPAPGLLRYLRSSRVALALTVTSLAVLTLNTYLSSFERMSLATALGATIGIAVAVAVWSGLWSLASRMIVQRTSFLAHFALAHTIVMVLVIQSAVGEWMAFFFPQTAVQSVVQVVGGTALVVALVAGHLALASSMARRRRWRAALIGGVTLAAISALFASMDEEDFDSGMSYSAVLKPVRAAWVRSITVDDFARVSADLKREVDALTDKR